MGTLPVLLSQPSEKKKIFWILNNQTVGTFCLCYSFLACEIFKDFWGRAFTWWNNYKALFRRATATPVVLNIYIGEVFKVKNQIKLIVNSCRNVKSKTMIKSYDINKYKM